MQGRGAEPMQQSDTTRDLTRKNTRVMIGCVAAVAFMVGLSFAAVPLYDLFCRVTGYGGTTQVSSAAPEEVFNRTIRIRFDASTNTGLPWQFHPEQREMEVRVGETGLAFYKAQSRSAERTVGTATFNVTPLKAGQYFAKTECFCFTEQALEPGQIVDMPVSFYIDPAIMDDKNLDDVNTITLSYTFFRLPESEQEEGRSGETAAVSGVAPVN